MEDPGSPSWTIAYTTNAAPTERPPSPSWEPSAPSDPSPNTTFTAPPSTGNPYAPTSGGFFTSTTDSSAPLSPPPSSITSSNHPPLPHPRTHPLRPGGAKEATLRKYIDDRLLSISRRYVKKFAPPEDQAQETLSNTRTPGFGAGYKSFSEVAHDLGEVVDVLWRSGTPSIQVPYFQAVALAVMEYLPAFPPARTSTLRLVRKVDFCLASLVAGKDVESEEVLPGFEEVGQRWLSRTDVVRLKGILDGTRVVLFDVFEKGDRERRRRSEERTDGEEEETDVDMEKETDDETVRGREEEDDEDEEESMDLALVYESSLIQIDHFLGQGTTYDIGDGPGAG